MNMEMLLAFLVAMIILSATPGLGVFAAVARAMAEGLRSALFFIAGLVIGDILFFLLALLGMATLFRTLGHVFQVVRIIGGMYLILLGAQTLFKKEEIKQPLPTRSIHHSFLSGLFVTLGNPKPLLFYASVVPSLLNSKTISPCEVVILMGIITVVSFTVIGTYCGLAIYSKSLANRKYQRRMKTLSGVVLLATGSFLLFKRG